MKSFHMTTFGLSSTTIGCPKLVNIEIFKDLLHINHISRFEKLINLQWLQSCSCNYYLQIFPTNFCQFGFGDGINNFRWPIPFGLHKITLDFQMKPFIIQQHGGDVMRLEP